MGEGEERMEQSRLNTFGTSDPPTETGDANDQQGEDPWANWEGGKEGGFDVRHATCGW